MNNMSTNTVKLNMADEKLFELCDISLITDFLTIKRLQIKDTTIDNDMYEKLSNMINLKALCFIKVVFAESKKTFCFENLEKLVIIQCNDVSNIYEQIFTITSLKKLNIVFCNIELISKNIKNLKLLEEIDLHHNSIETIPEEFYELENLTSIQIRCNDIQYLSKNILKFKKLHTLDVSKNCLQIFPHYVYENKNLTYVDLHSNEFENCLSVNQAKISNNIKFEIIDNKFTVTNYNTKKHYVLSHSDIDIVLRLNDLEYNAEIIFDENIIVYNTRPWKYHTIIPYEEFLIHIKKVLFVNECSNDTKLNYLRSKTYYDVNYGVISRISYPVYHDFLIKSYMITKMSHNL